MRILRTYGILAVVALLGGCAVASSGYDVNKLRKAQPAGDAFTTALAGEYKTLANFEADKMVDWGDAGYYARKGLRAAAGENVLPQKISERDLPADKVGMLSRAREHLVKVLYSGARDKVPAPTARAQAMFDCWMEQQEENIQPEHIARCRDGFHAAMKEITGAMKPKMKMMAAPAPAPAPTPAPAAPARFVVFFPFDSDVLTDGGRAVIQRAVEAAGGSGSVAFTATGHADRAGDERYNMDLSLRRAEAVRKALAGRGIGNDRISVGGRGEAENAVPTEDGVRERANRRVEIILLR
jgi:OmpA-OmpF porin, OOP family